MIAVEPGYNFDEDRSFLIATAVDPEITNTDAFGVYIDLEDLECDFVITRIYLQYDEDELDFSDFKFRVAELEDHSALIK